MRARSRVGLVHLLLQLAAEAADAHQHGIEATCHRANLVVPLGARYLGWDGSARLHLGHGGGQAGERAGQHAPENDGEGDGQDERARQGDAEEDRPLPRGNLVSVGHEGLDPQAGDGAAERVEDRDVGLRDPSVTLAQQPGLDARREVHGALVEGDLGAALREGDAADVVLARPPDGQLGHAQAAVAGQGGRQPLRYPCALRLAAHLARKIDLGERGAPHLGRPFQDALLHGPGRNRLAEVGRHGHGHDEDGSEEEA